MSTSTRPRDEFVEANDLRFHYREWGDPRTRHAVVLLHGYAETSEVWTETAQDLAREFRVIAIDQRGRGQSDRATDRDYTRASQMEDLEAIIESLGLRSVTLIGHSMGGANAICYAAEHPEMVSALVVIETAPEVLRSGIETIRRLLATGSSFNSLEDAIEAFREFFPYATTEQIERRVRASLTVNDDGSWSYDECTTYEVKSKGMTVDHTDRNTLRKVG